MHNAFRNSLKRITGGTGAGSPVGWARTPITEEAIKAKLPGGLAELFFQNFDLFVLFRQLPDLLG